MPLGFGLWRIQEGTTRLLPSQVDHEAKLEDLIENDVGLVDPDLMLIGRQVITDYGKRIDLLAVNSDAELVVIEIKRDMTPRDIVAQLLDYGSWVADLTHDRIRDLHAEYLAKRKQPAIPFEEAFAETFGGPPPDAINEAHRLLVVASALDNATERIISYLSVNYGVPVNAAFFRYYRDEGHEYLARAWLIDPTEVTLEAGHARNPSNKRQPWNGQDFYVSLGEGPYRTWEDARTYGFISGGQGKWYSRTLQTLFPGARVFVYVPQVGYVGVGTVTEPARPVGQFTVSLGGKETPILNAPVKAPEMAANADDPEMCEYLVRVEWLKTRPKEQAISRKGLFANENTACKLRDRFTLDTLTQEFELDG